MGAGGYVDETREAGGQSLWASAWAGEACTPFVQQGCPWAERSEPGGRAAIIHISTGPGFSFAVCQSCHCRLHLIEK